MVFASQRAPRIHVYDKTYWPPTKRAYEVFQAKADAAGGPDKLDGATFTGMTFADIEGTDISGIWGETWDGYPYLHREYSPLMQAQPKRSPKPRTNPKKRKRRDSMDA